MSELICVLVLHPALRLHSSPIPNYGTYLAHISTLATLWADAPELAQALALRLQLRLWRASARGFARLEAVLLDYAVPGSPPGRALRLARAACLRDVCALDPDHGVLLVRGLQVGLLPYPTLPDGPPSGRTACLPVGALPT